MRPASARSATSSTRSSSPRPYKNAWSPDQALAEITRSAGTHLDPRLVDTFLTLHLDDPQTDTKRHPRARPLAARLKTLAAQPTHDHKTPSEKARTKRQLTRDQRRQRGLGPAWRKRHWGRRVDPCPSAFCRRPLSRAPKGVAGGGGGIYAVTASLSSESSVVLAWAASPR